MKKIYAAILALGIAPILAQEVVLSKPEATNYNEVKRGMGRAHHFVRTIGFGVNTQTGTFQGLKQIPGRSWNYHMGTRYIGRLAQPLSFVWGFQLDFYNMTYLPEEGYALTTPIALKPDRLLVNRFALETDMGFRLYLNKRRGAYFGNHIDFGVLGGVNITNRWEYRERNSAGHKVTLQDNTLIPGVTGPWYTGAFVRFGYSIFQIPVRVVNYAEGNYAVFTGISFQIK